MNAILLSVVGVIGGILIVPVMIYCGARQLLRRRKKYRAYILKDLREGPVRELLDETCSSPIAAIQHIERKCYGIKSFRFTDAELGASFMELLGKAVNCQRELVSKSEEDLLAARTYLSEIDFSEVPADMFRTEFSVTGWVKFVKARVSHVEVAALNVLETKRQYDEINERWIRLQGHNPESIHRIDPSHPQPTT